MGIRCYCPNGHKLNLKSHLAGERGICPECGTRFIIPDPGSDTKVEPQAGTLSLQPPPLPPPLPPLPPLPPQTPTSIVDLSPVDPIPNSDPKSPNYLPESDNLPQIILSKREKIMTMRTQARRGARNTATFLLGITALILIIVLLLLI